MGRQGQYTINYEINVCASMEGELWLKLRMAVKLSVDIAMTVLLLCQMAYMRIGETEHEWTGTAMFVLFLAHTVLNRRWYQNLGKGKYTIFRLVQTILNLLILFCMLGLMVSGIIMSRAVFAWLSIEGGMAFARILHMLAAYWGFILMSIHFGLHWSMGVGFLRKLGGIKESLRGRTWTLRGLAVMVCGIGIYAFVKHKIADYLFLKSQFVFFDLQQPIVLFFTEYIAMMGLCICLSDWAFQGIQRLERAIQMRKSQTDRI